MRFYGDDFKIFHKFLRHSSAALHSEADDSAGSVRTVFFSKLVIFIALERRIYHPGNTLVGLQIFCHLESVFTVTRHSYVQALKSEIKQKCVLRTLNRTEITHKLSGAFGDKRALLAEFLRIGNAVIAVVGSAKPREFIRVRHPVEFARVDYRSAYCGAVSVHILGCGMRNYIRAPLYRSAINGSSKGIVYNKRKSVRMRNLGKHLYIEHCKRGIGNSLAENSFRIRTDSFFQILAGAVRRDKRKLDAHFAHRYAEKIEGSPVNRSS